jgi:hypothetical protein
MVGASAHLGTVAVTASTPPSCANVTAACSTFPCSSGAVTITLGAGCPLPLGQAPAGTIDVSGSWSSATDATLDATLTGVTASGGASLVTGMHGVTVSGTSVTYFGQDVAISGGAIGATSTWTVDTDDAGTPDDPTDDSYTVSGTDSTITGTSTATITAGNVVLSPGCKLNPTAGSVTWQSVNGASVSEGTLTFHSACDGMADSLGAGVSVSFFN